ncbi:MAG: 2,3,4,5-tetrahydropyridine-2,6-dicarboxylate N-succinyltransferase, partial [Acidiferrobacteraceae bacterium]
MDMKNVIEEAYERRSTITPRNVDTRVKDAVNAAIEELDKGTLRVAESRDSGWVVNEWLKKAVLLYFRIEDNVFMKGGYTNYYDKLPSKFADYNSGSFR